MNQVLQAHVFLFCLLSMILSPSWAVGEDWKLTFDQLSSHEMSFRIVVNADGKIAAFTKQRKSKEFEETSRSTITNDTVEDLRCRVIKLQQTLQTAELKKNQPETLILGIELSTSTMVLKISDGSSSRRLDRYWFYG